MQPHPLPRGLRDQLNPNNNNLALEPGGLSIGDSPTELTWSRVSGGEGLDPNPSRVGKPGAILWLADTTAYVRFAISRDGEANAAVSLL
jgi:hypothetical protein